jgi:DNA-binding transcriptional ArsR family regulator
MSSEDHVFKAIADPTRRAIIALLGHDRASVSELQGRFTISQPAISQHLKVLREAGLVSERREGRRRIYELNAEPLELARLWLEQHTRFWTSRLEQLGDHLRSRHGPDA